MATVIDKSGNSPARGVEPHIASPQDRLLALSDGIVAPPTAPGQAQLYVDAADGDLKVKFGDGVTKVIAADS